ncbi:MAG: cbb3-type cytochrome c oxidase subunit 3 [Burkholderiaceae bacterium]|jgi:cytochrome c oxidase cbb3-type subunit 4|nr:cbb3-type cytochrome c oxidase subunit 3 [Burkholderiaceae bacterium]
MDIATELQILGTVASFVVFVGLTVWAYSKGARAGFDEAEKMPFEQE